MRILFYGFFIFIFFNISVSITLANTINVSIDPVYAQEFIFYCGPYKHSFESNRHYIPTNSTCTYSIPATLGGNKIVAVYKGTPGVNGVFTGGDIYTGSATLIHQAPNNFGGSPQDGDLFFTVAYEASLDSTAEPLDDYLSGATSALPPTIIEGQNFYIIPWVWGAKTLNEFEPVVIIPGILGSWEKDSEWVLDPISHTYDNLVDTLLADGYVEGETLFKFPYDWRKSNVNTAQLLGEKITEIKEICNCSYVDLVAHSMGGLAASQYVASDTYGDDVDQILFLGTPIGGAPLAYKTWESGEVDFGDDSQSTVMQRIFERESRDFGFNTVFDYIHASVPSVQELLPVYDYLSTATAALSYPNGYPQNSFLKNLLPKFNNIFNSVRLYTVTGHTGFASTTIGFVVEPSTQLPRWEHGKIVTTEFGEGDGTVPRFSSAFMLEPEKEFLGLDHSQIVSAASPYVFETLNNRPADNVVINAYDWSHIDHSLLIKKLAPSAGDIRVFAEIVRSYAAEKVQKILTIVLYSPIDVEVTAPDGRRIGRDVVTDATLSEIPGALYSGPEVEYEYIIIPDPLSGEYVVKTKGTGEGNYTIATGYADAATSSLSFVSGTTTSGQVIENAMFLSPTTTSVVIEEVIQPPPPPATITPETCAADIQLAYDNKWISKKQILNALVADCKLLGVLIAARDKAKTNFVRKGASAAIKLTLDHMDRLAKDRGNTPEAVGLITKNTIWFREHEL